ncbi:uncharacterized protein SPSK_08186 [Sporothrix schenckii 1099-18]|uniref:Uncharacterized protein n=1 Tax=Sporothrix schenckii 1099-18 TaxID=1397361 RepID=A0A0F2MIB5_SPOSC|nr:uncharacterized protein SPSK_08186 [Sporothrix schenckii 1099-18]KJR87926.1 hypothetical protein SPSK_08186 [Sporothrix schenckii 1099-18]
MANNARYKVDENTEPGWLHGSTDEERSRRADTEKEIFVYGAAGGLLALGRQRFSGGQSQPQEQPHDSRRQAEQFAAT